MNLEHWHRSIFFVVNTLLRSIYLQNSMFHSYFIPDFLKVITIRLEHDNKLLVKGPSLELSLNSKVKAGWHCTLHCTCDKWHWTGLVRLWLASINLQYIEFWPCYLKCKTLWERFDFLRTFVFLSNALARHMSCLCPTDRLDPPSVISWSSPLVKWVTIPYKVEDWLLIGSILKTTYTEMCVF